MLALFSAKNRSLKMLSLHICKHWNTKAATKYRNFISKSKQKRIKPDYVSDNVWEHWLQLWVDPKCVEKSEINGKNRCGGKEVAAGTHTGGSICIGEHRKRLVVEKDRDPTPGEVHLHVHMMENLLLMSVPELSMKDIKKYYGKNHSLRLILINVKHITKLLGEQGREEYMVLDLKHKVIMGRILASILDLMLQHQHHLQRLNQHRQKIWRS
ncbi:uncharacterized protein LOC132622253 [Lycium barbarum]|uniref:uncharacterized protein LOC132622253 n=1 Tax=Lycium barbarum TaxID=112863 RepID=UPI00293F4808|nr:uncharacterized protein LOC132622253 [Lycium barbarum]